MSLIPADVQADISAAVGWLVAAGAGAFIGIGKIRRTLAADRQAAAIDDAGTEVINMLRKELVLLTEQNQKLASMVNTLQLEIIALRTDHVKFAAKLGVNINGKQVSKTAD
jgi:hypothetical protein